MKTGPIANLRSKRAQKNNEPSLLDQLSTPLRDFVADYKANGASVYKQLRERNPEKYAELSTKLIALIASLKPESDGFHTAQSVQELGVKLLKAVGLDDPTEDQVEAAVAENNRFLLALEQIAAAANEQLQ
jgi:hypothetical protein